MKITVAEVTAVLSIFATAAAFNQTKHRTGRFFTTLLPVQSILRFANRECGQSAAFIGTCFTRRECTDLSGVKTIPCASKRGVCCIVHRTCGGNSNVNNTYFNNPGYPVSFAGGTRCSIVINRCNSDICQLKLEFLELSLAQPDFNGNCNMDYFMVTGGSTSVPRICGENSGQHLYINFNGDRPITITIVSNSINAFQRRWNIRLMQLACNCPSRAPDGCLMYYTGTTGQVKSFNFSPTPNLNILTPLSPIGTREMVNLNYGVCVRVEAGFCSIRWYSEGRFSFTVSNLADDETTVGTANGAQRGTDCTTDFVVVHNPLDELGNALNVDRFCGTGFIPIISFSKPFVLYVITDSNEGTGMMMDSANRGFQLSYTQEACPL